MPACMTGIREQIGDNRFWLKLPVGEQLGIMQVDKLSSGASKRCAVAAAITGLGEVGRWPPSGERGRPVSSRRDLGRPDLCGGKDLSRRWCEGCGEMFSTPKAAPAAGMLRGNWPVVIVRESWPDGGKMGLADGWGSTIADGPRLQTSIWPLQCV